MTAAGSSCSADVLHAALVDAVDAGDAISVQRIGRGCSGSILDRPIMRGEPQHAPRALSAPPHVFAAMHGDTATLAELLVALDDELIDAKFWRWCELREDRSCCSCTGGRLTVLQYACARGESACVRALLRLGASASLPLCGAAEDDLTHDVARWSAYQLARARGHEGVCALLAEHGADTQSAPAGRECPVCYDPLDEGEVEVTRCAHRFHARCLPKHLVVACPLCRTPLVDDARPRQARDGSSQSVAEPDVQVHTYRQPEPPWLSSSAWTDCPTQRVFSELQRRRM